MIKFNFEGTDYNMTTNWGELTLGKFIEISKIQQKNTLLPLGEEMLSQQLIEALCGVDYGTFDEMNYGQASEIYPHLVIFIESQSEFNNKIATTGADSWDIDGTIYSYRKDPYQYTLGEVSDIKTYTANKTNDWDYIADVASVIIRPATKQVTEAGTEYFKLVKLHPIDLPKNREVVLKFKLTDVTRVVNFFLSGLISQNKDMKSYLEVTQVQE